MSKISVCGLSAEEFCLETGKEGFSVRHSLSVINAVYKKSIKDFSRVKDIPGKLREYLEVNFCPGIYSPLSSEASSDGTIKYLFRNDEGLFFETVYIPDGKRHTVCVSTQSGCRMGCPFCVTGKYGFHGNLTAGDIVNQVIAIPENDKITHVVFMGMGEPLDNADNVLKACRLLTAEWGKALGSGNITVSTVGITYGVKVFLENSRCNLTLSLFSPFTEERRKVVPAENKYPVSDIIDLMKNCAPGKRRRLSVAYVMIDGINDTEKHLEGLLHLLGGSGIRINLLPYHNIPGDKFQSSDEEKLKWFRHRLVTGGISASIRKSRGTDISAACGLLASGLSEGIC
jgi:23S rRNA (adenine2503-C2)-methyltransferase